MWKAPPSPNRRFFRLPSRRVSRGSETAPSPDAKREAAAEANTESMINDSPDRKAPETEGDHRESPVKPLSSSESLGASLTSTSLDESPKNKQRRRSRLKYVRRLASSVGSHANSLGHHLEDMFFAKPAASNIIRVNNGVLLNHCETEEEHEQMVDEMLDQVKGLNGEEGLRVAGFEFRTVYCDDHKHGNREPSRCARMDGDEDASDGLMSLMAKAVDGDTVKNDCTDNTVEEQGMPQPEPESKSSTTKHDTVEKPTCSGEHDGPPCSHCTTRLFHIESDLPITAENRRRYIADGPMYEEVARLCQEYAQDLMQREGSLEWITICNDEARGGPVRALVHRDHHISTGASGRTTPVVGSSGGESDAIEVPDDDSRDAEPKPTLLIATGKGKVRAGIFSREHLMCSGIEPSTALPMVREATRRNMNIAVLDPNARGDKEGMMTFEQSLGALFGHWEGGDTIDGTHSNQEHELYVLAHSQSGAQLVRYLLDRAQYYLPRIRAIAFTDSTHNIQWTKDDANLKNLLESSACVYIRSSNVMRDSNWESHRAGDTVETDRFWKHRFGRIQTRWAGTREHSLINWTAHTHIWDHFDRHLHTGTYFSNFSWSNLSKHLRQEQEEVESEEQTENEAKKEGEDDEQEKESENDDANGIKDSPTTTTGRGVPLGVVTV